MPRSWNLCILNETFNCRLLSTPTPSKSQREQLDEVRLLRWSGHLWFWCLWSMRVRYSTIVFPHCSLCVDEYNLWGLDIQQARFRIVVVALFVGLQPVAVLPPLANWMLRCRLRSRISRLHSDRANRQGVQSHGMHLVCQRLLRPFGYEIVGSRT